MRYFIYTLRNLRLVCYFYVYLLQFLGFEINNIHCGRFDFECGLSLLFSCLFSCLIHILIGPITLGKLNFLGVIHVSSFNCFVFLFQFFACEPVFKLLLGLLKLLQLFRNSLRNDIWLQLIKSIQYRQHLLLDRLLGLLENLSISVIGLILTDCFLVVCEKYIKYSL